MKQIHSFDVELRAKALEAAERMSKIVGSTLGPRGRNVILNINQRPVVTKDGVTISRVVRFSDEIMQTAADIIKQAAERTSADAGDGTTTTTILVEALLRKAKIHLAGGVSPIEIKRGMDLAVADLEELLQQASRQLETFEDVENVAIISANNDKVVGKLVTKAVESAGRDGIVTIEESRSVHTTIDAQDGFMFDSGYLSPVFVTDERRNVGVYENVRVLVTDYDLTENAQILKALELISRDKKPLLVVANEIEGKALAAFVANALRGSIKVIAVKAPRYGEERKEILKDLAISTGARFFRRELGDLLEEITLSDFGLARVVEVGKTHTTLVDTKGDNALIEARIAQVREELDAAVTPAEAEILHERLTRLIGGVVVIRVGGSTEVEMIEKKHRVEDALEAIRSAQSFGIVPGGGIALLEASEKARKKKKRLTMEQQTGYDIVLAACYAPLQRLAQNAAISGDVIIAHLLNKKNGIGYDFLNNKYVNMYEAGIIDPTKVTLSAIKNAVSAAGILLTAESAVVNVDEK